MELYFIPIFILFVIANVLAFRTKFVLKKNGYPVSYFWNHSRDIPNIFQLARKTENMSDRKRYRFLGYSQIAFTIFLFASFILAVYFSEKSSAIRNYHNILNKTINGIVIRTYIDSENHSYKTVELKTKNGIETNYDLVLEGNNVFTFLKPNDTIEKASGSLALQVKRKDLDTTLQLKFDRPENN